MKDTDVVKEMQYVFENFDANSDGVITTNDLGVIMRSLGENPSEEELKEMIREADPDGSGSVEIDESTTLMQICALGFTIHDLVRDSIRMMHRPKQIIHRQ